MVRIAHISDTHLGKRPKRVRRGIINSEIRPLEDDFYLAWMKFVNQITHSNRKPDIILHCGDFFDTPSGNDSSPPPEYARTIAAKTFKQIHDAKIPVVIIDGNHGHYMEYNNSTLSEYAYLFDNIHLFTHYDIRKALKEKQPLFCDFPELELRILAHPVVPARSLNTLELYSLYEKWISIQNNNLVSNMKNVFIAHGMISNYTLHPNIFSGKYNYIALGDDHKVHKVTETAWYSGSSQMCSFSEWNDKKGYLIAEINGNSDNVNVTFNKLESGRKIVNKSVRIFPEDTSSMVIARVKSVLDSHNLNIHYDYSTAARVRIILEGSKTYGSSFNVGEIESYLNRLTLDSDEYNIVEFILDRPDSQEQLQLNEIETMSSIEYLIDNAEIEFKDYISSVRDLQLKKENLDPNLLAKIFVQTLKGNDTNENT
ncbi:MAG: metallophosphoesterase [Nitrososphaeraceae archaeon]